ncbi:MAG: hypothetical protein MZV64_60500 [Ignavibacteriales bacterium]|nr:hypothetical protein [Ignavibacteriales bacterium]
MAHDRELGHCGHRPRRHLADVRLHHGALPGGLARHSRMNCAKLRESTAPANFRSTVTSCFPCFRRSRSAS